MFYIFQFAIPQLLFYKYYIMTTLPKYPNSRFGKINPLPIIPEPKVWNSSQVPIEPNMPGAGPIGTSQLIQIQACIKNRLEYIKVNGPAKHGTLAQETVDYFNSSITLNPDDVYYNDDFIFIHIPNYKSIIEQEKAQGIDDSKKLKTFLDQTIEDINKIKKNGTIEDYFNSYFNITGEASREDIKIVLDKQKTVLKQNGSVELCTFYKNFKGIINNEKQFYEYFTLDFPVNNGKPSYLEEYIHSAELERDKPLFLSPKDILLESTIDAIPEYMPEYEIFSYIIKKIYPQINQKNMDILLRYYRLCVISESKLLETYVQNSKYYVSRHFFNDTDIDYDNIPKEFKWNLLLNKLSIQYDILNKLIFPMMIIGNKLKVRTDFVPFEKVKNKGIIIIKIKNKKSKDLSLFYYIKTDQDSHSPVKKYYKTVNIWDNTVTLSENLGNQQRVQYVELNVALYTMRQLHNKQPGITDCTGVYLYNIKDEHKYLLSLYSIDIIRCIYTKIYNKLYTTYTEDNVQLKCIFNKLNDQLNRLILVKKYKFKYNNIPLFIPQLSKNESQNLLAGVEITNLKYSEPACIKKYNKYKIKYLKLKSKLYNIT